MYKLIPQIPPVDLYLFKWFPHKNYYPDWLIPGLISPLLYRWLTASNSFASAQNPLQLPCQWNPTQVRIADLFLMFSKAMFEYYEIFIIELGLLHLWPRTPLKALKDFLTGLYEFSEDGAEVPLYLHVNFLFNYWFCIRYRNIIVCVRTLFVLISKLVDIKYKRQILLTEICQYIYN